MKSCFKLLPTKLTLLFGLIFSIATAQESILGPVFNKINSVATSPEAALLGRFGDIPVSNYNGTASISIPLWTIDENDFKLPISLNYNTSGIKVEDEATWVGLGWLLEPGGTIIQMVNGVADEYDDVARFFPEGYQDILAWSPLPLPSIIGRSEDQDAAWPGGDLNGEDDPHTIWELAHGKGQPDIYMYSFAGRTGKFYINPLTKNIVILNKNEEIKFEKIDLNNWTALTLDGIKYFFSAVEISSEDTPYPEYEYQGYTWKLTKIELNNLKTIFFRYSDGGSFSIKYSENYRDLEETNDPNPNSGSVISQLTAIYSSTKYLNEIEGDQIRIVFNLDFNREDIIPRNSTYKTPKLNSIDIYSKITNERIKSYLFNYNYYSHSLIGGNFLNTLVGGDIYNSQNGKRLRLEEVKEIGYSNDIPQTADYSKPPYKFYYNDIILPLKTSFAKDYWGYYNGKNNNRLTPDLSFLHYSGAYPAYSTLPDRLFDGSIQFGGLAMPANFADRSVDTALSKAGMLNKIIYPTQGYSIIEYESNEFSNYNYPIESQISESTYDIFLMDKNETYNTISHEFSLQRTSVVRFNNSINNGTYNNATFQQMLGARITLVKLDWGADGAGPPVTTTLRTWQMLNHIDYENHYNTFNRYTFDESLEIEYQPNTTYFVSAILPDELGPQDNSSGNASVISSFTYYEIPEQYLLSSYGGGVRIKAILNYDENNAFTDGKSYSYTIANSMMTSGVLMSPLNFIYSREHFRADYLCVLVPGEEYPSFHLSNFSDIFVYFYSAESNIPFASSATGNIVGYSRVEVTSLVNDGISNGSIVQSFHNVPSIVHPCSSDIPDLLNGKLVKEEIFDNNHVCLKERNFYYRNLIQPSYFSGIKCFNASDVNPYAISDCCVPICDNVPLLIDSWPDFTGGWAKRFFLLYYTLENKWNMLDYETTKFNFSSGSINETKSYSYNSLGQLIESITTNSKDQEKRYEYIYPIDENSTQANLLKLHGQFDKILKKTTFTDEVNTEEFAFTYLENQNIIVDNTVETSTYNSDHHELISYDLWDKDKILQTTKDLQTSSFIWGYGDSQIISLTKNAVQAENAYTSFENNETNGWNLYPQNTIIRDGNLAHSGLYYLKANISSGPYKTFLVGNEGEKHLGYTASVWVKGNTSAYLHIEVDGQWSTHVRKANTENAENWTVLEVTIPKSNYESFMGSNLKFKVYVGGDANAMWDDIRFHPSDAQMTSFTYAPLIGMTSQSDINNLPTYFEYDEFGRLKLIRDHNKNILKAFEYNFAH